jgi:hypothetical protein
VATDHGYWGILRVGIRNTGEETGGADDIKSGDTEQVGWVKYASFFEGGSDDWNGGVDGIGDNEDVRGRCNSGYCRCEVANDGSISLKKNGKQILRKSAWGY